MSTTSWKFCGTSKIFLLKVLTKIPGCGILKPSKERRKKMTYELEMMMAYDVDFSELLETAGITPEEWEES